MTLLLSMHPSYAADDFAMPDNAIVVSVGAEIDNCVVQLSGERNAVDKFTKRLAAIKDKTRPVIVIADAAVPYRCIGGTIYLIQKAGFSRIGFVSKDTANEAVKPEKSEGGDCVKPLRT